MSRTVPKDFVTSAHVSTLPPGVSAYTNDGCRCCECRAGNADYQAELRAAYQARPEIYQVPHGTENGYVNYRCRCADCRRAHTEQQARRRSPL